MPPWSDLELTATRLSVVRELPYGKQRLVEIAIALAAEPSVLLLDEPAAGVPGGESGIILDVIEQLPAGMAVLMIEHDMDLVFRFARRITVMVRGTILVEGTPDRDRRRSPRARGVSRDPRRMAELLSVRNVSAGYGATVVLEHVSLSVDAGTTLAVLGRNGVGKTTLLATILGHTTRHDGSVTFAGQIDRATETVSPRPAGHWHGAAGAGDLSLAHRRRKSDRRRRAGRRIGWTLERVYALFPNLAERRRGMGNQLSGGEQQMLAIARALMGNPSLLLLDEPLEGLAPVIVDRLLEALQHLRSRAHLTMILTEQQARLALEFSDHAIILDRGRIVHAAPAAELLADPERLSTLIGVAR